MRILLLTQWFDPEPTFKGLMFAEGLKAQGHDVEVITGFPNYPGGKIYSGYKLKLYQKEVIRGVTIHRVWLYPSHDGSARKRIFNYLSFCISSCIAGLFFIKRFDLVYVYHPPMTVGLSAAVIGLFRRVPFVYDIQDLWPDTLKSTGMLNNDRILGVVGKLCTWIYTRAEKIIVLSPGFKKMLLSRGVEESKIEVIYNWCDEVALSNVIDLKFPELKGRFNILFAGNMGKAQALDAVLVAAEKVMQQSSKIQFVFVGSGIEEERLKKIVSERGISNVVFLPRMPMNQVGSLMSQCDALLVHLKKDPLFEITVPSKTQAYMAVGKPILMAVDGDAADLVNMSRSGVCVKSEDVEGLVAASLSLASLSSNDLEQLGINAKKYYYEHLSFQKGVEKFSRVFDETVTGRF